MKTMEQLTAAKTGKVLQELRNLIINFEQNGYSMGPGGTAFLEYMDNLNLQHRQREQQAIAQRAEYAKVAPRCPHCNTAMFGYPVNTCAGCMVGGQWQSQWTCPNPDCLWEEFNILTPEERFIGNKEQINDNIERSKADG